MLADNLKKEEKKQEAFVWDIIELTHMLNKEMVLRVQAETYEVEAIYVVETLQKTIEHGRTSSSTRKRTSCCNRSSFSLAGPEEREEQPTVNQLTHSQLDWC